MLLLVVRRAWRRLGEIPPCWIVAAAWCFAIAYAFPGYMNWDSADQIYQARLGIYQDWHAPAMAWVWHYVELFVRGPFGMLVIQMTLFAWGLYALLCRRFQARTAALASAALLIFPPILAPMAVVWKDAQMSGWMLAGFALALRPGWKPRISGLLMLWLAAAIRDNGTAALPPICLLLAASYGVRGRIAVIGAGFALWCALTGAATVTNHELTDVRTYPFFKANAIHDLAGTICLEHPMTDAEVKDLLRGIPLLIDHDLQANFCKDYNPRWWFPLTFGGNDMFVQLPTKPDRLARRRAWFRAIREHTRAWLAHRWNVMRELIGWSASPTDEPVCQTFAANVDQLRRISHDASLSWFQRTAGRVYRALAKTILFRPWAYLLLGLLLAGDALRRRDSLILALTGSGLLYEAAYFIGAAGAPYRYSHWMVTCTTIALVIVFGERLREGLAQRRAHRPAA